MLSIILRGNKNKTNPTKGLPVSRPILMVRSRALRSNPGGVRPRKPKTSFSSITPPRFRIRPIREEPSWSQCGARHVTEGGVPGGHFCLKIRVFSGLWHVQVDSPWGETVPKVVGQRAPCAWAVGSQGNKTQECYRHKTVHRIPNVTQGDQTSSRDRSSRDLSNSI